MPDRTTLELATPYLLFAAALIAFLLALGGVVRMAVRAALRGLINTVEQELTPNGGTSMKDALERIEQRLDDGSNEFAGIRKDMYDHRRLPPADAHPAGGD